MSDDKPQVTVTGFTTADSIETAASLLPTLQVQEIS